MARSALLREVARFLTVGGLATLVSFVGFNALVHGALVEEAALRDQPVPAFVLANVAGGYVAWVGISDNVSANVIGLGLGTAARFWVFRRFVFLEA